MKVLQIHQIYTLAIKTLKEKGEREKRGKNE